MSKNTVNVNSRNGNKLQIHIQCTVHSSHCFPLSESTKYLIRNSVFSTLAQKTQVNFLVVSSSVILSGIVVYSAVSWACSYGVSPAGGAACSSTHYPTTVLVSLRSTH